MRPPQIDQALEVSRKNLQILYAQGVAVSFECKSVFCRGSGGFEEAAEQFDFKKSTKDARKPCEARVDVAHAT
jgi:hypothetical protein